MIIHYLNIICITAFETEAYPPLIIDADAVLPGSVTRQFLQMIAGRDAESIHIYRGIYHIKLPQGNALKAFKVDTVAGAV